MRLIRRTPRLVPPLLSPSTGVASSHGQKLKQEGGLKPTEESNNRQSQALGRKVNAAIWRSHWRVY
jgi:hypothetical protein